MGLIATVTTVKKTTVTTVLTAAVASTVPSTLDYAAPAAAVNTVSAVIPVAT